MPAAAVIPAPIAYITVVAVKKLVVGFLARAIRRLRKGSFPWSAFAILGFRPVLGFTVRGWTDRRLL